MRPYSELRTVSVPRPDSFFVSADGYRHLTTQINIDGDEYLHDDFAFATREELIPPVEKVSERFRYLYDRPQLESWTPRIAELADKASVTHVVFNNCYANYGTTNALEIGELISRIYRKR